MFRKILALLTLTAVIGCSSNPVSVEKLSTFNLSDYSSFDVKVVGMEDTKVSPFTRSGLKREFIEQLSGLGLSMNDKSPDFIVKISIDVSDGYKVQVALEELDLTTEGYAYDLSLKIIIIKNNPI